MNSSHQEVSHEPDVDVVVDRILQVIPRTMRRIRHEMRAAGSDTLSVPQLRALLYVRREPGTDLSSLADHLGLTLPGASGLVDRLVRAGLLERSMDPDERRRMRLRLTADGAEHVGRAHLHVRARLSADLGRLSATDLRSLADALETLDRLTTGDVDAR